MARQEKSLAVCLEILQDYTSKDFSLFAVLTTADFYLSVDNHLRPIVYIYIIPYYLATCLCKMLQNRQ